jgi:hypothetical protein
MPLQIDISLSPFVTVETFAIFLQRMICTDGGNLLKLEK